MVTSTGDMAALRPPTPAREAVAMGVAEAKRPWLTGGDIDTAVDGTDTIAPRTRTTEGECDAGVPMAAEGSRHHHRLIYVSGHSTRSRSMGLSSRVCPNTLAPEVDA